MGAVSLCLERPGLTVAQDIILTWVRKNATSNECLIASVYVEARCVQISILAILVTVFLLDYSYIRQYAFESLPRRHRHVRFTACTT